MSLRDKLEAQKAAALAQEQAAQEQSKAEVQKQVGESIATLYGEQQKLISLLGRINEITSTEQKVAATRSEMKKKGDDLREIHRESVENEATENLPSPVTMLQSEDFQEESEITGYNQAKESHRQALKERKALRDELIILGIDDMNSPEAITKDVKSAHEEKKIALRTLVQENPEVQTPEALEVRGEMIQERETEILRGVEKTRVVSAAQDSIQKALQTLEQNRWFKDRKPNVEKIDEFKRRGAGVITRSILDELAATQSFNNFVASIKVETQKSEGSEEIDTQAIKGALKKIIFNYTVERNGEFGSLDPIYNSYKETKNTLPLSYEAISGVSLDEYLYPDKSGYKSEVGPVIQNLLDDAILETFSKRMLEVATLQGKLDSWDSTVVEKEGQVRVLREKISDEERIVNDADHVLRYQEGRRVQAVEYKAKKLSELESLTQLTSEDRELEAMIMSNYHGASVSFPALDVLEHEKREEFLTVKDTFYKEIIETKEAERAAVLAEPDKVGPFYKKVDNTASKKNRQEALGHEIVGLKKTQKETADRWFEENITIPIIGRSNNINKVFENYKEFLQKMKNENFTGTLDALLLRLQEKIRGDIQDAEKQENESAEKISEARSKKEAAEAEKIRLIEEVNALSRELSDNFGRDAKDRLIDSIASHRKQITT